MMRNLLILLVVVTGSLSQTVETPVDDVGVGAEAPEVIVAEEIVKQKYTVGIIESAPYAMRAKDANGTEIEGDGPEAFTGFLVDILKEMEDAIGNTTFELKWATEGYGQLVDGQWTGIIKQMKDEEFDVGAGPISITKERQAVVDFSKPITGGIGITLTVKEQHIKLESAVDMVFFVVRPFSFPVWILFGLSFVVFAFAIFALNKFHPFEHKGKCEEGKSSVQEAKALDLGGSFWMAMTLCVLQGFDRKPRSKAGRTLFAIWGVFVLLTIILYITSMVEMYRNYGRMTRGSLATVEDIIDSEKYEMGYIAGGSTSRYFQEHADTYPTLKDNAVTVDSLADGLAKVREGNYGMFIESDMLRHAGSLKPCEFAKVGHNLNVVIYGFVLHKEKSGGQVVDNVLKKKIDDALLVLQADAILADLHHDYFHDTAECPELPEEGNFPRAALEPITMPARPLTPYEYSGAIVLLIIGLVIVTIIAIIENLYIKFKNRPRPATRPTQEKLIEAEEGQALNATAMTEVGDKKPEEEEEPKEDVGKEFEPEDKVEVKPAASEETAGIESRATPAPVEVKS